MSRNYFNDLLPLEYTEKSLNNFCDKVNFVQDFLGRQILIENSSSYLQYEDYNILEWDAKVPEFKILHNEAKKNINLF